MALNRVVYAAAVAYVLVGSNSRELGVGAFAGLKVWPCTAELGPSSPEWASTSMRQLFALDPGSPNRSRLPDSYSTASYRVKRHPTVETAGFWAYYLDLPMPFCLDSVTTPRPQPELHWKVQAGGPSIRSWLRRTFPATASTPSGAWPRPGPSRSWV